MKIIRFTEKKEYLIDELENGFLMGKHEVVFSKSGSYILNHLVEIYRELNIRNGIFGKIASVNKDELNQEIISSIERDSSPVEKATYKHVLASTRYQFSMKCFTELRDNQKLNPNHVGYFGDYGISMKKEWVENSKATPVIYVRDGDEYSKKLGLIISFLKSLYLSSMNIQSAIMDILSYVEISNHRHEYEWRVSNSNPITGGQIVRLPFNLSDVDEIFVPKESDFDEFSSILSSYPGIKINLTEDIILNSEELKLLQR